MPEIPIIRIPFSEQDVEDLTEGWINVLNSGYLTLGKYTAEFEEQFQEFTGAKYAVSVSNGTSALEVMIRALDIEGKSIIARPIINRREVFGEGGRWPPGPRSRIGQLFYREDGT